MSCDKTKHFSGDNQSMSNNIFDGPLVIVLDDDDDLEDIPIDKNQEKSNVISNEISSQTKTYFSNKKVNDSTSSPNKSQSNRIIHIDTSFNSQISHSTRRKKSKFLSLSSKNRHQHLSIDSSISSITFDQVSNILTISRMGSIYYCVEDIYLKVFSLLCIFDEFINLLIKPQIVLLKDVNLSEKLSLIRENPRLKRFNRTRYRLISIDSSDYLLKLKQSLLANKQINKIIAEMSVYRQLSNSTKRSLIDDSMPNKHRKSIILSKNSFNSNLNKSMKNIRINNILSNKSSSRQISRSKSLLLKSQHVQTCQSRSSSLPSVKFNTNISTINESIDSSDNNFPMPMIVQIEENVQIDDSIKISSTISEPSSIPHIPYPYNYQPPSFYLSPIRTPYNLYYPDTNPFPMIYKKCRESEINVKQQSLPIIKSILTTETDQNLSTVEQFRPMTPRSSHPSPIIEKLLRKKPISPQRYTLKTIPINSSKHHRIPLSPYPPTRTYFAPLSSHHSSQIEHNQNVNNSHCNKTCNTVRSSIQNQSIDLSRAIIDHNQCNIDKIPKLVIRHRKIYRNKILDTMGQLFPSWFDEPDYRCIHCFNCDRVFTPQLFMTHVDDQQLINEQPIEMTSIQLLTSEKMSESKVYLWNTFCTNLTLYAREGRISGF